MRRETSKDRRLIMMQKRRMGRQGSILHSDNRLENLTWMTKKAGTIDRSRPTTWADSSNRHYMQFKTQGISGLGRIFWSTDDEQQLEPARFVTVRFPETDEDTVVKFMLHYWKLSPPSALIAITGSAQGWATELEPQLEALFEQGLKTAAQSTRAWVTSGGTETGSRP